MCVVCIIATDQVIAGPSKRGGTRGFCVVTQNYVFARALVLATDFITFILLISYRVPLKRKQKFCVREKKKRT